MTPEELELLCSVTPRKVSEKSNAVLQQLASAVESLWRFADANLLGDASLELPETAADEGDGDASSGVELEEAGPGVRGLELLRRAGRALEEGSAAGGLESGGWWRLRWLGLCQSAVRESGARLTQRLASAVRECETDLLPSLSPPLSVLLGLECTRAWLQLGELILAQERLDKTSEAAGFKLGLSGQLGKRTRFQDRDVAQLLATTERGALADAALPNQATEDAPVNCALNDDTLLERVQLSGPQGQPQPLSPLEAALVLTKVEVERRLGAGRTDLEEVGREETRAYLDLFLSGGEAEWKSWPLSWTALWVRTETESGERRRAERSLAQAEELQTAFRNAGASRRSSLFWAAGMAPSWKLRLAKARLLKRLGIIGEAVGEFEKAEAWDEVIACYTMLGKGPQAEAVVRERLAAGETPALLCALGDVTHRTEHYERAWDLSKGRCGRAQKALGDAALSRKDLEGALGHFRRAVEVWPLDLGAWYSLGYASMELKRWEEAATAYHRCARISPEDGSVWNNLAAALLHQKLYSRALLILQDALRFNYDSWKVWENFVGVAAKEGAWSEVVRGLGRLLELKERYWDEPVAELLVRAAVEGGGGLLDKTRDVLDKAAKGGSLRTSRALELHALALRPKEKGEAVAAVERFVAAARKAHQRGVDERDWTHDETRAAHRLLWAADVARALLSLAAARPQARAQARLLLDPALATINASHTQPQTTALQKALQEVHALLDEASTKPTSA